MEEYDDESQFINTVDSAAEAESSWAGRMGSVSISSASSSFANAFAMRQGMGLDVAVLQSAIMDANNSSYSGSGQGERATIGTPHQPWVVTTASGQEQQARQNIWASPQQEHWPGQASISSNIQPTHHGRVNHYEERKTVNVEDARNRLKLMRERQSELQRNSRPQEVSPSRQDDHQGSKLQQNVSSSSSDTSTALRMDMTGMSSRVQAAAAFLMEDDDDGDDFVPVDLNAHDGIMFDVETEDKSSSSSPHPQTLEKSRIRVMLGQAFRKPTMWAQEEANGKGPERMNTDNLVLHDSQGEKAVDENEDQFVDEDPSLRESYMARQFNKRKRIKITKRIMSAKVIQRKRRERLRQCFLKAFLFLFCVLLVVVGVTMVVKQNHSTVGGSGHLTNVTDVSDEVGSSTSSNGAQDDKLQASTDDSDGADPESIDEEDEMDEGTVPPGSAPNHMPPQLPTASPVQFALTCFTSRDQLKEAIYFYIMDRSKHSPVARKYGWPISEWCVSGVTDFSGLFHYGNLATGLVDHEDDTGIRFAHFDEPLSGWDVSNAVDMSNMFRGAKRFTGQGLDQWNVSKVTTMSHMFHGAESFNQDLNLWNVSSVTNFEAMFEGAKQMAGDVSKWNTHSAQNMQRMFRDAHAFNGDLRGWNTSSVKHMAQMFARAISFSGNDLRRWDVSKVNNMEGLFFEARSFDGIISNWNVRAVRRMSQMFQGASIFNSVMTNWDVSNVEDMSFMFAFTSKFNAVISDWNTQNVRYMDAMFYNATRFNQPIGNWNVSSVKDFDIMFMNARSFNQPLSSWTMTSAEKIGGMFGGATSFQQNLCAWGLSLVGGKERSSLLRSDHIEARHVTVFSDTMCAETGNPIFLADTAGPFCTKCY